MSAYTGAAAAIADKGYLTVAASILTVEARHSAIIREAISLASFPKAFDTPLDFNFVFSLAAQFITGFADGDVVLPFKAFPSIVIEVDASAEGGSCEPGVTGLTFIGAFDAGCEAGLIVDAEVPVYAVFFSGLDIYYSLVTVSGSDVSFCVVLLCDKKV